MPRSPVLAAAGPTRSGWMPAIAPRALRRGALVTEQPQVPRGGTELLAHPAEGGQPAVGIGCVGEPPQHHRQQRSLDRSGASDAAGQRFQVTQRSCRVGVAERLESLSRCGGVRRASSGELSDGRQQRPVEQLLVQPAYLAAMLSPGGGEVSHRIGAKPQRAAQPAQIALVVGHDMCAAQPEQLDAVLQRAQEAVGVGEALPVVAPDVPAVAQRRQRVECRRAVQRWVEATVDELQQLHRELHIAQPTWPKLQCSVGILARNVLLHALPHGLHVGDKARAISRRPDEWLHRVDVLLAELQVAGGGTRLEQGLELQVFAQRR